MKVKHGRNQRELDRGMTVRRLLELMDAVFAGCGPSPPLVDSAAGAARAGQTHHTFTPAC